MKATEVFGEATLHLADCLEVFDTLPKNAAVLSDPPYGIGYKTTSGKIGGDDRPLARRSYAPMRGDDSPFDPSPWLVFDEVILWGANHYANRLPSSAGWLIWDKRDGMTSNANSDCEIGWLKNGGSARIFRHLWNGMCQASEKNEQRVHPTQKPVALMTWCLRFLKSTIILDPYMGSGTAGIAAVNEGRAFVGCEVDQKYFSAACRRIEKACRQRALVLTEE